jgi:hypothetical protein
MDGERRGNGGRRRSGDGFGSLAERTRQRGARRWAHRRGARAALVDAAREGKRGGGRREKGPVGSTWR